MADFYQHFNIDYKATQKEVQAALDLAYQNLQKQGGSDEQYRMLREAQDALLNPMNRVEYDKKIGVKFEKPPAENKVRTLPEKKSVVWLSAIAAVLLLVLVLYLPRKLSPPPAPAIFPGMYLVSASTGEEEAVLRKFEPRHVFHDGSKGEGYEILVLKSNETEWLSEKDLLDRYKAGGFAPRNLMGN